MENVTDKQNKMRNMLNVQSLKVSNAVCSLLQEARHQLTLDLQHKTEALDVDMSCLSLTVTSSEISLKPNPTRIPPA